MRKRLITTAVLICILIQVTACGERTPVDGVAGRVRIEREPSLYEEEASEETDDPVARDCLDYLEGTNGKTTDYYKAAEVIRPQLDSEDPDILYCLGIMHGGAMGLPYDPKLAYDELTRAEQGGNDLACVYLGSMYEKGMPAMGYDYAAARDQYRHAVLNGTADGYYGLGHLYAEGHGVEKDPDKAMEYFNKAIAGGTDQMYVSWSQLSIAEMYERGDKRDHSSDTDAPEYDTAMSWFEKAMENGSTDAAERIGHLYMNGLGVEADIDKAISFYERAAASGDVSAACTLGRLYASGTKVKQDGNKALEWFQKPADLNDPAALYYIGQMYDGGMGIKADPDKAREYYQKAIDAGYKG